MIPWKTPTLLVLFGLLAGCAATTTDGGTDATNPCVISVIPMEPKGGWMKVAALGAKDGIVLAVEPSQYVSKSGATFYDPDGNDEWKVVTSATKFRFLFKEVAGDKYSVMLQKELPGGGWTSAWSSALIYDVQTKGDWLVGTWKVFDASATQAQYLVSFGGDKSGGFLVKGALQYLNL